MLNLVNEHLENWLDKKIKVLVTTKNSIIVFSLSICPKLFSPVSRLEVLLDLITYLVVLTHSDATQLIFLQLNVSF